MLHLASEPLEARSELHALDSRELRLQTFGRKPLRISSVVAGTGVALSAHKRHVRVHADGRSLEPLVHPADVQDRDGACLLLRLLCGRHL